VAALVVLFAADWVAGLLARRARLPHITGALAAGLVLGPLTHLVTLADVRPLALLASVTLAWIAVLAGGHMTPGTLRETWRSALASSVAQIVVCAPLLALAFAVLAPVELVPLAALWGIVTTTRSPIITIAVISERKADGPLARHLREGRPVLLRGHDDDDRAPREEALHERLPRLVGGGEGGPGRRRRHERQAPRDRGWHRRHRPRARAPRGAAGRRGDRRGPHVPRRGREGHLVRARGPVVHEGGAARGPRA
jgi:hypothetical protein